MIFSTVALAFALVIGTIATGIHYMKKDGTVTRRTRKKALAINFAIALAIVAYFFLLVMPQAVMAASDDPAAAPSSDKGLGLLAMALSTGLATIGTGYAVGAVGSSALGAISEDPKILGKTLIYVGLAEGIAIYGLIISILILGQLS